MNKLTTKEKLEFLHTEDRKKSKHNKYRNLVWDKPSPTIVAHLHKDGLMFIHPDAKQARSITVREAAALQSFMNTIISSAEKWGLIMSDIRSSSFNGKKISLVLHKYLNKIFALYILHLV